MALSAGQALDLYGREVERPHYLRAKRYIDWGGSNADAVLGRYVEALRAEGLADGTIDLHLRTIRAFYRRLRERGRETGDRSLAVMHVPEVRSWRYAGEGRKAPVLGDDVVERLVAAARSGVTSTWDEAMLAMATAYGLRAGELAAVRGADVKLDGRRLFIRTEKGGRRRWCWMPPAVADRLDEQWERSPVAAANHAFGRLWEAAELPARPKGVAWHAMRRAVTRGLVRAGVAMHEVATFMRWSQSGLSSELREVLLYANPTHEVSVEGLARVREGDEGSREYDQAAWDRHPFLGLWG